jgi:hypothetical protein
MRATLLRTQALSPVQLMVPPFVLLTFSKYLRTQIPGKRETKAAILEEVLPSTESQGAGITQDGYMMVDKRCVVPEHGLRWRMYFEFVHSRGRVIHFLVEFLPAKVQKVPAKSSPLEKMQA